MKRYVREAGTLAVQRFLASATPATSRLSEAEISAALARRSREGRLAPAERLRALDMLHADLARMHVVELATPIFADVHGLLGRYALRAADALHLAAALSLRGRADSALEFVGYDDRLNAAARAEGLPVLP